MPAARTPLSFRVQIALVFGTIGVVLAGVMSALFSHTMASAVRSEAVASLQVVAGNTARVLTAGLDDRFRLVTGLAGSPTLWENGLDSVEVSRSLGREQATRDNVAWMGVADLRGIVHAATGDLLLGANVSARPWFAAARSAPYVGDLHDAKLLAALLPARPGGEPWRFLDFSAPIRAHGQTLGVIGLHGSWDWARSVVESLLPKDAHASGLDVFVFDRAGTLIYGPPERVAALIGGGQRLPSASTPPDGEAGFVGWADGAAFLTARAPLEARDRTSDLGWTIVARVPDAAALATARSATQRIFAAGALLAALAALLAWLAAGKVSGPLSAIAEAARRVKDGSADVQMPRFDNSRELSGLSDALATMTGRLLAANESLERRVAERTAALEAANGALDRLARHDPLTQLLNRRGFDEEMKRLIAEARRRGGRLSMVMIDVDHFKRVNDTHGHETGDRVLQALGAVLRERLRETDVIGRIGGEEFAALLPDTGLDGARRVADELVAAMRRAPMPVVGGVTISCGISLLRESESGRETLVRADRSLYRAKSTGRDRADFVDTGLEPCADLVVP